MADSKRKAHWEKVYQSKPNDQTGWFQPSPQLSLKMIESAGIAPDDAIIDVGGGASRLIDALLERGYHSLSVLDISTTALEATQTRLGKRAEKVNWLVNDVTEFTLEQPVRLWHDRAVFHFLTTTQDRKAYLKHLQRYLVIGGHLIMAAFSPEGPTKCSGLDIVQYDGNTIQQILGNSYKLLESTSELHQTPSGVQQHFNYFHFIRTN
ncbi:MAG: class I SAM-dependent methyltransferase [Candidatus Sedimenticola sp. (ex Thyasira tokunagai)]